MRVLLAVESCEAHLSRCHVIRETWAKDVPPNVDLQYFTGPMLECPDDYANLSLKTKAICMWASNRDYDYLSIIDTDTYVHVHRLLASGFEQHKYSGFVRPDYDPKYCYGPCYWLSRDAFIHVAYSRHTGPYEDVLVGEILSGYIEPHHDERYSHWFAVTPQNDKIIEHLNSTGGYSPERMYRAHKVAYGTP